MSLVTLGVACLLSLFVPFSIKPLQKAPARRGHPEIYQFVRGPKKIIPRTPFVQRRNQAAHASRLSSLSPPHSPVRMYASLPAAAQRLRREGNWPFRSLQGPPIRPPERTSLHCGLSNSLSWKRERADRLPLAEKRPNQGVVCHRLLADGGRQQPRSECKTKHELSRN